MRETNRHRHLNLDFELFPKGRIWEMHPEESARGFSYFKVYRDMGTRDRSLVNVAAHFGVSEQAIAYYSSACHWVKRVDAYEAYLDREVNKAKLEAVKALSRRQIQNLSVATTALMIPINKMLRQNQNGILDQKMDKLEGLELLEVVNKYIATLSKVVGVERVVYEQPTEIIDNQYSKGAQQIIVLGPDVKTERVQAVLDERTKLLEANDDDDDL